MIITLQFFIENDDGQDADHGEGQQVKYHLVEKDSANRLRLFVVISEYK